MSGGRLYSNSEVISPPSIACFCFMVKLVYLCAQSNQRARCPTSFTVIGWLYKTPVSNSLDNSPPSLLAGRRTEPLSDSMQMTTIDNQIFFSHALTSYGFKQGRLHGAVLHGGRSRPGIMIVRSIFLYLEDRRFVRLPSISLRVLHFRFHSNRLLRVSPQHFLIRPRLHRLPVLFQLVWHHPYVERLCVEALGR